MSPQDLSRVTWRKSSRSSPDYQCTMCAFLPDGSVAVKDSKLGDNSPILTFTRAEWLAFIEGAKAGEFDI
jgi:hypothetical protein